MADRTFEVNITTAVQAPYAIKKAGYAGEHNATAIQINLPADYIGGFTYSLELMTGAGEAYLYPLVLIDGDDFLYFELSKPSTDKGTLDFQLKITETATGMVVKTRVINLQIIGRDVSAYAELADNYVPPVDINGSASGLVIEYADLDAPYAGYPFRHTPSGKIVEQEHYVLPLNVPLELYVNPVPPLTDVIYFHDSTSEMSFFILPPEQSGVQFNIAALCQALGLNENGEDVTAQYIYSPQEVTLMGITLQKGWTYLSLVDGVPDSTTSRPLSYDEVPRMLVTIGNDDADEWEPAGGTYLSETPYLSEGSLYYWNGAEYVEVGADLSAYATKEYVDENSGITVNEVAPVDGNITLDTSNIESTLDRWYLTDADRYLLYALKGASTSEYSLTSFVVSGTNNEITGTESAIVAGGYNRIPGNYSAIIGGAGNLASATCSATIGGEELIASASHSAIVGKFGETPAGSLFAVANGTSVDSKNIAFYVGGDGIAHFDEMPEVPADRVITEDNQLVDKKYVDENAGSTAITELTGSVLSVGNFYKTVDTSISFTLPTADTSKSNLIMLDLKVVGDISIGFGTTYAANMSVPLMVAGNYLVSWEYSNIVSDWIVTVLPYGVIV